MPTTTETLYPRHSVTVSGSAVADFGWRPIVRSTDPDAPITSFVGPSGVKIESYNDVVAAETIHDALMEGRLVGDEAAHVRIRHDLGLSTVCATAAGKSGGVYTSYSASCNIA